MREIKFRVWSKIRNNWVHPALEITNDFNDNDNQNRFFEQFTGLKDKNGKDIYEGDKLCNGFNAKGVVKFIKGMFICHFVYNETLCVKDGQEINFRLYNCYEFCEVIGNIHENKTK